jgi:ABC-2 type transport system permease protein
MRNVISILRREVLSFFVSPIAYFVITGFLLLAGYFFFNLLAYFNLMIQRYNALAAYRQGLEAPNLNQLVVEPYYHTLLVILVFLIPVLTMRAIAEERKRGTFELLMTSPLSVGQIVLGKFLGVGFVVLIMSLLIFAFPLLLVVLGDPGPELKPVLNGLLTVFLCGLSFSAVSMAVSSFTENQIVAAISGMVTLLLLYVIHSPAETLEESWKWGAAVLRYLSPVMQAQEMIRGVFSLEAAVYFLSLILVGLFVSGRALDAQRWR